MIGYNAESGELTLLRGAEADYGDEITLSPHASRAFMRWLYAGTEMPKKVLADKAEFALEYSAGIRVLTSDGTWRLRDREQIPALLGKMLQVMCARGGMALTLLRVGPVSALWGPTFVEDGVVRVHARHGARVIEKSMPDAVRLAHDPAIYTFGDPLTARVDVPRENTIMTIWERY